MSSIIKNNDLTDTALNYNASKSQLSRLHMQRLYQIFVELFNMMIYLSIMGHNFKLYHKFLSLISFDFTFIKTKIKESGIYSRNGKNEKDGEKYLEDLRNKIKVKHKALAERIEYCKDNYLGFLKYPEGVRKHIYTTNAIESINAGLEYIRHELGGYFPSRNALETNYFIQIENLNDGWQRRPVQALKASTYELRQIYTMKYELEEWGND